MEIKATRQYDRWLRRLRDHTARARIELKIDQWKIAGEPVGDIKSVGHGVSELRIPTGPGYRIYFARKGTILVILLAGGDKSSQATDIRTAHDLLDDLRKARQW